MKENEKEGKKRNIIIRIGAVIIALIVAGIVYFFFISSITCTEYACFQDALVTCSKAEFVRDDADAAWRYVINKQTDEDTCRVTVTLLFLKEGNLDLESLQGLSMACEVLKSTNEFPEQDISRCTGKLKEGIQETIIQRMHNYLLENVGELQESFRGV